MGRALTFVQNISLFAAVFLVPLAFAPWTFEAFEFNKQVLLVAAVTLGVLAWIAKMVLVDRELRFKRTPLDLPILAFLLVVIASALFSQDRWSSLFGYYGRFSDSLLVVAAFVGLYFLAVNTVEKPQKLVRWFLIATGIAILASYLSLFGVWQQLETPFVMQQGSFNLVAGSMEGFAVFLAAVLVFLVFQTVRPEVKQLPKVGHLSLLFFGFALFLMVDIQKAWVVLLAGLLLVLAGTLLSRMLKRQTESLRRLWLPVVLLLLVVVFLFSPSKIPSVSDDFPKEPMLSQEMSWSIAWQTATENIKNAFVGSGQGTFAHDFSKHRPESFNTMPEWQNRFDRAGNYIAELLATAGFLGLFSFLSIIGFFFVLSWFLLKEGKGTHYAIGVLALVAAQLVYYQTIVLGLAFWLFLAAAVISFDRPAKEFVFSLRKFPEVEMMGKTLLIFLVAGTAGLLFFGTKFYLADARYLEAQNTDRAQQTRRIDRALEAARLNPYQAEYRIFLSRLYLGRALDELKKPEDQQNQEQVSRDVQRAIAFARGDVLEDQKIAGAIELAPNRVATWGTLGAVYRDIKFAAGALDWAIRSFENAIALEPTNPVLRTELGKLYVAKEEFQKAKEQFGEAASLKPDYVEAQRQSALVLEKEGNTSFALANLRELALRYPLDMETLFQLGRLSYNAGQVPEAISQFRQVLDVAPNHSNARFALAVALESQGRIQEAIREFQRVLGLNPGSETVKRKLQELQQ